MKNTLGDLNEYLFAQLDVLSNTDLKGSELLEEIERSEAITDVAKTIIGNANTMLQASKIKNNSMSADPKLPKILEG